jgi:hypothetical protein
MIFAAQRSMIARITMLALLAISVFAGSPAFATSGNGAIHISDTNCHDDDGYIACMTAEGVANETITPSGNAIHSGHVRTTFTLTDPAGVLIHEGESESHFQRLHKDEMLHLLSDRSSSTMTRADGVTCTFSYTAHLANGQLQFEHNETECHSS